MKGYQMVAVWPSGRIAHQRS